MGTLVTYSFEEPIASIAMDDGKVNVLSLAMLAELDAALDCAQADGAVVLLSGRDGVFSAGFDLASLRGGGTDALDMLRAGFELAYRLLSFPRPVVTACTGHAIAMGSFLLLSGDHRIGAAGEAHKIVANEVAIGLTMPHAAVEICRQRLTPAAFNRAVLLSEQFTPDTAVAAGFLDQVVPAAEVRETARAYAGTLAMLDATAHAGSKLRAREGALAAIRAGIERDDAENRALL